MQKNLTPHWRNEEGYKSYMFVFKKTFPPFMYRSQIVQNILIQKKKQERLNAMELHKRHKKKNPQNLKRGGHDH
jgi:hypothetical protein